MHALCLNCTHKFIKTGLSFWKAPNRKIYAVSQTNLDALDEPASDGSGDDEWTPRSAKRLKKEFTEGIKKMKEEMVTLMSSRPLPYSIMEQLTGIMKCCICQVVPVRPPLVISSCCKSIVGCEQCVQQLIDNQENSNCPLCRCTEFAVTRVNGFDGLISAMGNRITEDAEEN